MAGLRRGARDASARPDSERRRARRPRRVGGAQRARLRGRAAGPRGGAGAVQGGPGRHAGPDRRPGDRARGGRADHPRPTAPACASSRARTASTTRRDGRCATRRTRRRRRRSRRPAGRGRRRASRTPSTTTARASSSTRGGLVLTNRHVAEPWWNDDTAAGLASGRASSRASSACARSSRSQGEAFDADRGARSPTTSTSPLLRVDLGRPEHPRAAPRARARRGAVAGQPVVVVGYPTGLEAILAKAESGRGAGDPRDHTARTPTASPRP